MEQDALVLQLVYDIATAAFVQRAAAVICNRTCKRHA
jgi:hypothetical protein